jgi:hypothetical protein
MVFWVMTMCSDVVGYHLHGVIIQKNLQCCENLKSHMSSFYSQNVLTYMNISQNMRE